MTASLGRRIDFKIFSTWGFGGGSLSNVIVDNCTEIIEILLSANSDLLCNLCYIGVWGRGAQTGNSLKRGVYVCERVACVMERWLMLAGQIRGSECTAAAAAPPARILDWVLSRFCLGFVSVLSRPASPKLPITQRVALSVQIYIPTKLQS